MVKETLNTPVTGEYDVFVLGGGIGGITAAISAARNGAKVLLVERSYCLGGLATSGLIAFYLPLCDGYGHQVSYGIVEELLKLSISISHKDNANYKNWIESNDPSKRTEKDPRYEVEFNPNLFAISCENLLLSLGVEILFGTYCVSAIKKGDKIEYAIIENKTGRQAIKAKTFIDASGDADLAFYSQTPTDTFKQGNVLAAWYYSYGEKGYKITPLGACDISDEEKAKGNAAPSTLVNKRFTGIDAKEVTEYTILSHNSTLNDTLNKRKNDPTYVPATICSIPELRMTRKIVGEFSMTTAMDHQYIDDSIGIISSWRKRGPIYEVAYSSLYSNATKNLITAGRVTSCDEAMWDLLRVIPACAVTGEAAGLAATMGDDFSKIDVEELQDKLRKQGVKIHLDELDIK
ncbi:MAG: FAD-dependent oxidoreductase [Bacilli bacterium]|nr:FAD-dependent oxidoreductase [Bacilli bacterium]